MKKYIYKLSLILAVFLSVTGCQEKYPIMFDSSGSVVGFSSSSLTIKENDQAKSVNIYLGATLSMAATDVALETSTEGISKPAIEEVDYTISSKNVSVGAGETAVTITPIDNNLFDGDKQFKLIITSNSKSYPISAQRTVTVTITDDEHPLKAWIGTYSVSAASYGKPGVWDEQWTVTTSPVEGQPDKLSIKGIGVSDSDPLIATINLTNLTITIEPGQNIGAAYSPDYPNDIVIYYGFPDLSLNTEAKITGTVSLNGTMKIDHWGELYKATSPEPDWTWDVFNTTWTKK